MTPNLTPEQKSREKIDRMLNASGWIIQDMKTIDFSVNTGIAVREYQTEVGQTQRPCLYFPIEKIQIIEIQLKNLFQLSNLYVKY